MLLWLLSCATETCADGVWNRCAANTDRVEGRLVLWQVPDGEAPAEGWPVAILFQGSLTPAQTFWGAVDGEPLGGAEQVVLTTALLDAGFAVLTPEAVLGGFWCWNTNVPGWANNFANSPDHRVIQGILDATADGTFGPLNPARRYAAGISSGGYMTSRMAEAFPGEFAALAVISASWATCVGSFCEVPDILPADHPPTFFGHGADDWIVPHRTMQAYAEALDDQGTEIQVALDMRTGHGWFPGEAELIVDWFVAHP